MQTSGKTGIRKGHPGMTEWGRKARKAEARTKRSAAKVAALKDQTG